ncbi:FAD-binding oxidoreductase [Aliiroseovarius sp. F47248L]|uniref:NAD(P)/FAD-dependent oxidoreductase n=1 Tax=Aliiroseovarius sp. F47248L TaxID=2926420 RepID=UPI001FF18F3F|nr:FAD-binding oxidoreductase [Aliiroseovarius sp. F47248L]MCK0137642.1 FAD-binding oxidoreductase [Aliiroseovarius sp. F47248L]
MQDFIVIGGGVAGVSAGARLSHLGTVTLLEAENALAYHASGRSAAMFEESYGAPSVIELNRASRHHHVTANGGVLSPRGLMIVARKGQEDLLAQDLTTMNMQAISFEEAQALVPILNPETMVGAGYHTDAWDIDTDLLVQNFAREVRSNGQVVTGAVVQKISRLGAGWEVTTPIGTFAAKTLVNAAGAWVDQIATLAGIAPIGIQPYRRSMARIPAPDDCDVSRWPMFMGAGESWYAKPDAGALIVSPADADPVEPQDAWADDMVLAEGLTRYENLVTEPVTRMITNWAGLRSFAPDRNLVIGPSPQDAEFLWFAGQGGYGFQTCPAASRLLADIVAGTPSELDSATVTTLSPARFS